MRPLFLAGIAGLALIWGGSFMFMKVMLEEMGPLAVAWTRVGGGATFILLMALARGRRVPLRARHWLRVAPVAFLGTLAPWVLIPWGEREIDSGLAAILNATTPFFAAIFAHLFLSAERITPLRAAGLALGFAGVAVIVGPDIADLTHGSTQGQLAVVLASAGYGAGAVYTRRFLLGIDSTVLAGSQGLVAFVLLTPLVLSVESVPAYHALSPGVLFASLALALAASGVAIMIYYWLLGHLHAAQVAIGTYLVPVTAVFWGWLVLEERLSLAVVPGLLLIVAGIYLVSRPVPRPTTPAYAPTAASAAGARSADAAAGGEDAGV